MTEGKPAKVLCLFAVPIVLANIMQQLYNIVDSVIVGHFLGEGALAAVGTSAPVVFLSLSVCTGMSMGFSILISQLFGGGFLGRVKCAINTALIATAFFGGLLTLMGFFLPDFILRLLQTPDDIFSMAHDYLRIIFFGMLPQFLYSSLNSIFNALGNSKAPLVFLSISATGNVILDLLFVVGLGWGVSGAAVATVIAQTAAMASSLCYLFLRLKKLQAEPEFTEKVKLFDFSLFGSMMRLALPSMLQQSIVAVGSLMVQGLVNRSGSTVIAGYNSAVKLDQIACWPMFGLANALTTFTAQNLGARKVERVEKGFRTSALICAGLGITMALVCQFFGRQLMGIFVDSNASAGVIDIGSQYLQVVSLSYVIGGLMFTCNAIHRGSGDVIYYTIASLISLGARVGSAYLLNGFMGYSAIWWSIPIGWILATAFTYLIYRKGYWREKVLVGAARESFRKEKPV